METNSVCLNMQFCSSPIYSVPDPGCRQRKRELDCDIDVSSRIVEGPLAQNNFNSFEAREERNKEESDKSESESGGESYKSTVIF